MASPILTHPCYDLRSRHKLLPCRPDLALRSGFLSAFVARVFIRDDVDIFT